MGWTGLLGTKVVSRVNNEETMEVDEVSEAPKRVKMKVTIKRWHDIAAWHWDVNDECCGICRMPFDSYCVDCKKPGDDCPPVWGKCNHAFHLHCILKWVNTSQTQNQAAVCPMCRQPWEFK